MLEIEFGPGDVVEYDVVVDLARGEKVRAKNMQCLGFERRLSKRQGDRRLRRYVS